MKIGKHHYSLAAAEFSHLVGKYIRMERYAEPGDSEFDAGIDVGAEFTVAYVRDCVEEIGSAVEIMGDYGMGFIVNPELHEWRFTIWNSETQRKQFQS